MLKEIAFLASAASDHDMADSNAYLLRRMLNGVPEGHQEMIPGTSLPLESCMDVMGGGKSSLTGWTTQHKVVTITDDLLASQSISAKAAMSVKS